MTDQSSRPSPDPIGDFQRWLIRSGARSVTREMSGQLRSVLGRADEPGDVWDRATKPPPEEAPECAWCPLCRAARALRESGPAAASQVAAAGGALTGLLQEIKSAVESALAASRAAGADGQDMAAPEATIWADVTVRADVSGEDVTVQDVIVQDVTVQEARVEDVADEAWAAAAPDGSVEAPGGPAEAAAGPAEAAAGPAQTTARPAEAGAGPAEEPGPSMAAGGPPDEPDDRG
jgi:hypothetical protein